MRAILPIILLLGQACVSTPPMEVPGPGASARGPAGGASPGGAEGSPKNAQAHPAHSEALVRAEALLATYAQMPSPDLLQKAVDAVSAEVREDERHDYARFLMAYLQHLQGQEDASKATLAATTPERRQFYARFFSGELATVRSYLEANVHQACTEAAEALPELCKDRQEAPRPADYLAFQLGSSDHLSRDRLRTWGPGTDALTLPALFESVGLAPGQAVAELGAQDGWFSVPLAGWLGPEGHLYAAESDPGLRGYLGFAADHHGLKNLDVVAEGPDTSGLAPGSVDSIFECEHLRALYTAARREGEAGAKARIAAYHATLAAALRPGGRLVLIEHAERPSDDKAIPESLLIADLEAAGLRHVETSDRFAPLQMVLTFELPAAR